MPRTSGSLVRLLSTLLLVVPLAKAWVELDENLIPAIPVPLPVLTLGPPGEFPPYLLDNIIGDIAPGAKLEKNETVGSGLYAYQGDRLVASVDPETGEVQVFPNLADIVPTSQGIDPEEAIYSLDLGSSTFPTDDTFVTEVVVGASLVGAAVADADLSTRATDSSNVTTVEPETYLTHGSYERRIDAGGVSYPVCGPGSQANFGVDADGRVHSLSYLWRTASLSGSNITASARPVVASSIKSQLEPIGLEAGWIRVTTVDVCFYDSGAGFIQPVYRFVGTTHSNSTATASEPVKVSGYVPIGSGSPEVIPSAYVTSTDAPPTDGAAPTKRSVLDYFNARSLRPRAPLPEITVGRYVVRNDARPFLQSAINTWKNLRGSKLVNFVNSQYYWGNDNMYISRKDRYVNSVNVAYTEGHGNWHLFTTEENCCDVVRMENVPDDGYGPAADGSLAYWMIHACEPIPTPLDYELAGDETPTQSALAPWRHIFRGGLHAVLSYRTQMYIQDTVPERSATLMAQGVPVISAWLKAANTDSIYRPRTTYASGHYSNDNPFGRAAVVFQCGHESDRIWQLGNAGQGRCLRMIWYNNA
ncbi:hypothetical protein H1R20_g2068, partial [Candolleomyces eurysporus]